MGKIAKGKDWFEDQEEGSQRKGFVEEKRDWSTVGVQGVLTWQQQSREASK